MYILFTGIYCLQVYIVYRYMYILFTGIYCLQVYIACLHVSLYDWLFVV